jgi:uncharacterized protein YegP (UPF0339 family)
MLSSSDRLPVEGATLSERDDGETLPGTETSHGPSDGRCRRGSKRASARPDSRSVPVTFEIYEDQRGEYRLRLVASNGRTVGDSGEGYATRSNARRATENARRQIGDADIEDQ